MWKQLQMNSQFNDESWLTVQMISETLTLFVGLGWSWYLHLEHTFDYFSISTHKW